MILASGSDFVTGMNRGRIDMATPYLREALRFIGISRRPLRADRPDHRTEAADRGCAGQGPSTSGRNGHEFLSTR